MAVRNRAVVPALPTKISALSTGQSVPHPVISNVSPSSNSSTWMPILRRALPMIRVSSLTKQPWSRVLVFPNAARMRARLVMLLEPGTECVPDTC